MDTVSKYLTKYLTKHETMALHRLLKPIIGNFINTKKVLEHVKIHRTHTVVDIDVELDRIKELSDLIDKATEEDKLFELVCKCNDYDNEELDYWERMAIKGMLKSNVRPGDRENKLLYINGVSILEPVELKDNVVYELYYV